MQKLSIVEEPMDYYMTEAYKVLRTNLQFCGESNKVILLTSTQPGEGKSTVAMQLSKTLSEANKKVLLIDADLRKSVLIARLVVGEEKEIKGMIHFLSGQCDVEEMTYQTNIPNLDLVLAGGYAPNPTELLDTPIFEQYIQTMRETYDYVVVDTPPLGLVIDSAIIAKYVDGAVIVVESEKTKYNEAQKVKSQLEMSNCKILGVILNKVNIKTKNRYYSGSKSKYYKKRRSKYA